ncbi:class I SAM-dependent methyltransferase [Clostridium isatidis]|uniref:class I SAM-dependent methyltransferase n=1 Tax=Clostridium isatidis TaxID=182773 RepID=UPI003AB02982
MEAIKCLVKIVKLFLAKEYTDLRDIENSYSRVSKRYNDVFLKEMDKYNKEMLEKLIIKYIDNNFNGKPKILDLACGTGFNSSFISTKLSNSSFTLVDISNGMLKEAKNCCKFKGKFVKSDKLSYLKKCPDNSFDIVICGWAIKYQNPYQIIKEVSRVLKKDGYFAVIVNLKGTLPEFRRIYPKLILKNYKIINKLMREIPNPVNKFSFARWFKKKKFSVVDLKSGVHIFNFNDADSLVNFVTSTGALAGFDTMVDMYSDDVKRSMINLFNKKGINTITHKYVWRIFKNNK